MTAIRRHIVHLAILFALALVAASCGGSSADPADAAPPVGEAATDSTMTEPPATETPGDSMDDMDMEDGSDADHGEDEGHDDAGEEGHDDEGHEDEGHDDEGHDDEGHDDDDGHDDDTEVPEDARVEFVFMNEYGYAPEDFVAAPGETVVYRITNTGELPHEFRLSNAHRVEEHIESGHEGHGEEGGHHASDGDITVELEPGTSTELVVTFPMDESVFTMVVCLIPEHYEKGMHAELTYS